MESWRSGSLCPWQTSESENLFRELGQKARLCSTTFTPPGTTTHTCPGLFHISRPHHNNCFCVCVCARVWPHQLWPLINVCSLVRSPATFSLHRGMTITRCWSLIKVDNWQGQRFQGAINQPAQAHSSLHRSDGGLRHRSLSKKKISKVV